MGLEYALGSWIKLVQETYGTHLNLARPLCVRVKISVLCLLPSSRFGPLPCETSVNMDKKSSSGPPRVAYIWSQELQDVSDQLPANIGRSSMVHGLIRALNYLEEGNNDDHDGHDGHDVYQTKDTTNETNDANGQPIDVDVELEETEMTSSNEQEIEWMNRIKTDDNVYRRARVVQPDLLLGTTESLRRYHDARYVGKDSILSKSLC